MAQREDDLPPEDRADEPGAEAGVGDATESPPATPDSDDASALGDTDQHSDSPA